jgi:hypothetical protein
MKAIYDRRSTRSYKPEQISGKELSLFSTRASGPHGEKPQELFSSRVQNRSC